MLKIRNINQLVNLLPTYLNLPCVRLVNNDRSNALVYTCREWMAACIGTGNVYETTERLDYYVKSGPFTNCAIRRNVLVYYFEKASDAMAFSLMFSDRIHIVPMDGKHIRKLEWVS